jgi:hypothetical protein
MYLRDFRRGLPDQEREAIKRQQLLAAAAPVATPPQAGPAPFNLGGGIREGYTARAAGWMPEGFVLPEGMKRSGYNSDPDSMRFSGSPVAGLINTYSQATRMADGRIVKRLINPDYRTGLPMDWSAAAMVARMKELYKNVPRQPVAGSRAASLAAHLTSAA